MTQIDEAAITPVAVKSGLNAQQRGADQLGAEFLPRKIKVLGSDTDPQHPMKGKAVGSNESQKPNNQLAETMAEIEEDMLSRMRRDLNTYLDQLQDRVADDGKRERGRQGDQLSDRVPNNAGLKKPEMAPESVQIRALRDGSLIEIAGTPDLGFELRRGDRRMSCRFPSIELAETMMELFQAHRDSGNLSRDYLDEH
jgi:hypothetical protein